MNGRHKKPEREGETGREESGRLTDWLVGTLDIPPDILEGGLSVEIRGRYRLYIRGCRRILQYSPEEMCFQMKKCVLKICGHGLICHSFLSGAVGIEGRIDSISFADQEAIAGREGESC